MSYVPIGEVTKAWEAGLMLGRQRRALPPDVREQWRAKGRQLEEMLVAGHQLGSELRAIPFDQCELGLEFDSKAAQLKTGGPA